MSMRLNHLTVSHAGTTLAEVSALDFEPGCPVTIVGESGSGKSLLAHAIMGTLPANLTARGSLTLDGQSYDLADRANRRRLWGRQMALLPQEPALALDPTMRAREQVAEGARTFPTDKRAARRTAGTLLASLGLGQASAAFPHTLSGGMAQRVAFAAATIGNAPVLIADEPSKGLDQQARTALEELLKRHLDGGGILLTITHDLDLARGLGGEVLVMRDAHILEHGPARDVLTEPVHAYTRRLLAAEPANWTNSWGCAGVRAGAPTGGPLISGEGLAKAFGGQELFSDLSVTIRAGERIAFSGPSGSGKTTLGNVLLRLLPPDTGHVHHAGTLRAGRLQKLYQDPAAAFPPRVLLRDSFGDVLRRHRLKPERLEELMASLRLAPALLHRKPGQVSGGELQRLAIIRSMLLEPALLFADEPTSRLDLITQQETMNSLMGQADRHGCALVLVTHDDALARAVTHRRIRIGAA
ncbi:ABC transporter ATP-binding protein [Arthrobacter sp. NPDC058130]|uniref:ABC transporter ATP-binding protein n=1 Tax=Arthrobacter sp. NPDC058130 TaxID=3346353 RepID=UPI0036E580B0